ncbi:hypothetical protein K501DRAFT_333140 [Backusella circina FSU 941]|nr:hypothetical protein K501DRAFT_333140 [Backusella circina FSU 941]
MSDTELKDDWTTLLAKEALALRSGQAWADIVDDDDEDNVGSNEINDQLEGSITVVDIENNEKPVDYLDDIDLAIPLPQPRAPESMPTRFYSDNYDHHPSHDSDNWRARNPKSEVESDNWRVRDPHRVKSTTFASFGNKDRFDDHRQQEDRREYRKPENRRVDPEDAAALSKWNTFHLVVAQEELEKEKEKERLKNLYLESCNNDGAQSSELIKGDTNQQVCMKSSESQKLVDQNLNTNQPKADPESISNNNNTSESEEKQLEQSKNVKIELASNEEPINHSLNLVNSDSLDKKIVLSNRKEETIEELTEDDGDTEKLNKSEEIKDESLPTIDNVKIKQNMTLESIDHKEEKENNNSDSINEESNDNEAEQDKQKTSDIFSKELEEKDKMVAMTKNDFEEKHESVMEKRSTLHENENFKDEAAIENDVMSKKADQNNEKETILVNEEIKSKISSDVTIEHQLSESSNNETILEQGDSLEKIQKEYTDVKKQRIQGNEENEIPEIVGTREGEEKKEPQENLQSGDTDFENPQPENNKFIDENAQNDNILNVNNNSVVEEATKMSSSNTTNDDNMEWNKEATKESDQTNTTGWGKTPIKEETGWVNAVGWNKEPEDKIEKDGPEGWTRELTKEDEEKGANRHSDQVDSQTESNKNNDTNWNREIVQDKKADGSNNWSQEPTKQWGKANWDQNQNSNNVKSESSHSWGTVGKNQSPKIEAKKPSSGSWRDQIESVSNDDNVGGWKQFATDQAARSVVKETRIESPKPKKAFLSKNVHNNPKLEKNWASDTTAWSTPTEPWTRKSDILQTTSTSSTQSNIPQSDSSLLTTNLESGSRSPILSHVNPSWSNMPTSNPKLSYTSHKDSTSSSTPNLWAKFSALEKERLARSQTQSKQVTSQVQLQQKHEAAQTTSRQQSNNPPVLNISLSDFDSIQLEHKSEEAHSATIEINMSWNGGDMIIHTPAENSTTMHAPLMVPLDEEPQGLSVTPKLEHAALVGNSTWSNQTHSDHSREWNTNHVFRPESSTATTRSSSHRNRPKIQQGSSQWKQMNSFLDK